VYATRADKHGVKIIQSVRAGVNPSSAKQINLNGPHIAECAKIAIICAVIALTVIHINNPSGAEGEMEIH
jgi:sulfate transporter 2, low-affinity